MRIADDVVGAPETARARNDEVLVVAYASCVLGDLRETPPA